MALSFSQDIQNLKTKLSSQKSYHQRIKSLNLLKNSIIKNENEILNALKADLGKGAFESYLGEIDFVLHEIDVAINKLKKWMKPTKVRSALTFFPVKSSIYKEPYGCVLIIGPWNYPFQLIMAPLIGAIAAGNVAVLKPSEISVNTSKVLNQIISGPINDFCLCIEGGVEETQALLEEKFDYIFYTGNSFVGKIIMAKAAKYLTPVTLELGGKSPAVVLTKNLDLAAKRIVWGKYFNVGQTCVAPDYVLIRDSDKQEFIKFCDKWIKNFYGENLNKNEDYGRIINHKHFDRIKNYIQDSSVLLSYGENRENLYLGPVLMSADENSAAMKEEIFGPLLPIVSISDLGDAIKFINKSDKPLASYIFCDDSRSRETFLNEVSAGGCVVNDTLIHLSNENLPFGGVGNSGMGAYHGKFSFELFSHQKAVMKRSFLLENSLRYPPYQGKLNFIRKLMKLIS